jgi:hypothetical protein
MESEFEKTDILKEKVALKSQPPNIEHSSCVCMESKALINIASKKEYQYVSYCKMLFFVSTVYICTISVVFFIYPQMKPDFISIFLVGGWKGGTSVPMVDRNHK